MHAAGILLRVSCIFVSDGTKTEAARGGFARSEALGKPGAGHGLASLSGRINEVPDLSGRRFIEA